MAGLGMRRALREGWGGGDVPGRDVFRRDGVPRLGVLGSVLDVGASLDASTLIELEYLPLFLADAE